MSQLLLALIALFATLALTKPAVDPKNDPLGEPVNEDEFDEAPQTTADFGTELILPFTEKDQRTQKMMQEKYPTYEQLDLKISSIEPEAGPYTGATRVMVRGGPFKDM